MTTPKIVAHETIASEPDFKTGSDRVFGLVVGGILALLGASGVVFSTSAAWYSDLSLGLGGALFMAAIVAPEILRPLNVAWMRLGWLLGKIVNPIVLGIMFFLVLTPLAVGLRLTGKSPIKGRFDPSVETYWRRRDTAGSEPNSMKRQF